jgi:hypothetical protein
MLPRQEQQRMRAAIDLLADQSQAPVMHEADR